MAIHNPSPLLAHSEQFGLCSKYRRHVPVDCLAPCYPGRMLPKMQPPYERRRWCLVQNSPVIKNNKGVSVTLITFRCFLSLLFHSSSVIWKNRIAASSRMVGRKMFLRKSSSNLTTSDFLHAWNSFERGREQQCCMVGNRWVVLRLNCCHTAESKEVLIVIRTRITPQLIRFGSCPFHCTASWKSPRQSALST